MTIYVEIAIIDNMIINCLLLNLTSKIFKYKYKPAMLVLTATIGTVFALLFPLLNISIFLLLLFKMLAGVLMILIFFKTKKIKRFVQYYILFLTLTFLLGGFILAIFEVLKIDVNNIILLNSSSILPVSVIVLCIFIFYRITYKLIKLLNKSSKINSFIYNVKIKNKENIEIINAFLDTGNSLKDMETGLPVNIISSSLFERLYPEISLANILLDKKINLPMAHFINFSTIAGSYKKMLVFMPESMLVFDGKKWIENNALIGITFKQFKEQENYEMLLNVASEVGG